MNDLNPELKLILARVEEIRKTASEKLLITQALRVYNYIQEEIKKGNNGINN